jgi:hypothetical protein
MTTSIQPLVASQDETYLRFIVDYPARSEFLPCGLFTAARLLRDDHRLAPHEAAWLAEIYDWFNDELPCPPFSRGKLPPDSVCWYRASAKRFIARMWDLAALLIEHGEPMRMVKTRRPGLILYSDEHQVVALPHRFRRHARRWYARFQRPF